MDENLRNMIAENNALLKEAVENTRDTNLRIRKIHGIMRKTFWSRIGYWVLLLLVTAGAFYAIIPTVNNLIAKYSFINADLGTLGRRDSDDLKDILDLFNSSDTSGTENQ